jgi:hypothetical protein
MDVARQPVELGDDQGCTRRLGMGERGEELRAIILPARLDLSVFAANLAAGDMRRHRLALRLEAEPALTLPRRRNPQIRDEAAIHPSA